MDNLDNKDLRYIIVLDFEATCWEGSVNKHKMEIIEFPSVIVEWNVKSGKTRRIGEFQQYCKPKITPRLTKFCTNLTGITQQQVDNGISITQALDKHHQWLEKTIPDFHAKNDAGQVCILTVGRWDIDIILPKEMKRYRKKPPAVYKYFINVKAEFVYFLRPKNKKGYRMANMLKYLNIPLQGRHHSGIDDCKNTASILEELIARGMEYDKLQFNYVKY